jgi:photosystem II stability/assembly factor-like uncharacterized protein
MRKLYILLIGLFVLDIANAQWIKQTINEDFHLNSVYFTDAITGYAVGDSCYFVGNQGYCNGIILKTTNGGTNWTVQKSVVGDVLFSIFFLNPDTGFTVGNNGTFLKTTNGGISWTSQTIDSKYVLSRVYFTDINIGYAVGGIDVGSTYLNSLILKTIDGGANWSLLTTGLTNQFVHSICFPNKNLGFAVADNGQILKTTNSGTNWTLHSVDCDYLFSVFFVDDNIGFSAGNAWVISEQKYYVRIFKTTNGGADWTLQKNIMSSNEIGQLNSVYFTDVNTGYLVGNGQLILKTINGGDDWIEQPLGYLYYLNDVFFADANTGYAAGNNGTIFKTTNGGISSAQEIGKESFKIYPNPVTEQLTIETVQMKNENILTISNIRGQELIRHQINDCKIQINIGNLTSGIYFVKLITDEKVITRKIIKK